MELLFVHGLMGLAVFGAPGFLLSRLLRPDDTGLARVASTLVLGPIAIGLIVTTLAVVGNVVMPRWGLLAISACVSGLAASVTPRRDGSLRWHFDRKDWIGLGIGVLVFAAFLVQYDRALFQFNCVNRAAALVLGIDPTGVPLDTEYLFATNRNVRLGNVSLVSPFFITFGFVGARLLYALIGLSLFLWGTLLGRRVLKTSWAATALGLLLALNPYVLAIPILDENLFACLATTIVLTSLCEKPHHGIWLGVMLGMLVGFRHMGLLLVPAVLWVLSRQGVKRTFWRSFGVAFALVLGLWALHHQHTFGAPWAFESFKEYHVDHAHSFLGMDFGFRGLLNWPFQEQLTRTPYNPYPTAILLPLWLLNRLGLALLACLPLGVYVLRNTPLSGRVLAACALPFYLPLSVMANWMQPNKMGIVLLIVPCILLPVVVGLEHAIRSWRQWKVGLVVLVSALAFAGTQMGLANVNAPIDARVYELEDPVRTEHPDYQVWERTNLVRHNLWPDWTRVTEYSPWAPGRKWADLWFDLTTTQALSPSSKPTPSLAQEHASTVVTLDFSQPLIARQSWATASSLSPDWRLNKDSVDQVFELPVLRWSSLPGFVAITSTPSAVHVVLEFHSLNLFPDLQQNATATPTPLAQAAITLQVPAGTPVTVTEVVADHFSRYYRWTLETQEDAPALEGPRVVFTN